MKERGEVCDLCKCCLNGGLAASSIYTHPDPQNTKGFTNINCQQIVYQFSRTSDHFKNFFLLLCVHSFPSPAKSCDIDQFHHLPNWNIFGRGGFAEISDI